MKYRYRVSMQNTKYKNTSVQADQNHFESLPPKDSDFLKVTHAGLKLHNNTETTHSRYEGHVSAHCYDISMNN